MASLMSYKGLVWCCLYFGCEDTDSGCDVSCIVYMLPYILDVFSYIEAVMSYVQYCDDIRIGCDVLYSACDVTQKLGVMSFKTGCDIRGEVVMTEIQWVQCLIEGVWCHAWSGCDIINTVVWCDRVYAMSSAVQRMSHICQVCCPQHRVLWCHT